MFAHILIRWRRFPQFEIVHPQPYPPKMHHSLATLLSILTYACCVESRLNHSLVRRVPLATDLFSFNSAGSPGSCTAAQQALVSSWVADAITLNTAALMGYGFGIGKQDAVHMSTIMGIQYSPAGPLTSVDGNNYVSMGGECSPRQIWISR